MGDSTILIVDDEPTNLALLSRLLNPSYLVRACKSGEQAIVSAGKEPRPDLILLDVMMPGMDGYTILSKLREDEKTRDIPVIFVTALDDELDEEKGIRLGAVDYLAKPVKPSIVLARVNAHVEIKQARDRLKSQNVWLEAEVARRMRENLLIQDVSLCAMAQLAETRDSELGNHISRTQAYVEALAHELQSHADFASELDDLSLNRIVKASPLHDIGKVGIPDHILLKPGKLTSEEWEIMKTHTRIGGDAIRQAINKASRLNTGQISDTTPESLAFLKVAQIIATSHHEKWDGTGYPDGLAGRAIPLPARLMALADVFDALTTPRIYKTPWSMEEAAAYIREQKGKHFGPEIVEAFDAVREVFEDILRHLSDAPPGDTAT
ncbi:MAG: two-component system response regulator [Syntrophobacter sp.]